MASAQADINAARGQQGLPIVSVFMSETGIPEELGAERIPSFRFPEDAARALGHAARYGRWRARPLGNVVSIDDADVAAARGVVAEAFAGHDEPNVWLDAPQTERLLSAFGITTARTRVVASPEEAAAAQVEMDAAVAVKAAAPVHKTELGGVRLGLRRPEQVADAVRQIAGDLERAGRSDLVGAGFVVQEMVGDGVEMVVGVTHDRTFGPILLMGMGGTLVELLADVSVRIHPLTDIDVDDMLTSLRGYPLLTGYRGSTPVDTDALKGLLFRVSAMVEDVGEIDELDLNPVFVRRRGLAAVDARVKLSRDHTRPRR